MFRETASVSDFTHRFVPAPELQTAPTLLLLHGTGGNENDLLPLGQTLLKDANLLSPRGRVLERGMPRFFRRLAEGVFDQEDLRWRTGELAGFLAGAAEEYGFDPTQVIAVGYSNGANIAASLLLRQPEILAGAILLHPMVPFTPETLPDLSGKSLKVGSSSTSINSELSTINYSGGKPIFIGAGENDPIVPATNTEALAALLRQAGAEVALYWHRGGHSLTQDEVQAAQQWLLQRSTRT